MPRGQDDTKPSLCCTMKCIIMSNLFGVYVCKFSVCSSSYVTTCRAVFILFQM